MSDDFQSNLATDVDAPENFTLAQPEDVVGSGGSLADTFTSAMRAGQYQAESFNHSFALMDATQNRIDAIHRAIGAEVDNPFAYGPAIVDALNPFRYPVDALASRVDQFHQNLSDLAKQFPDQADVIGADRSPEQDATQLAGSTARAAQLAKMAAGGGFMPGAASFFGEMTGALRNPINAAALFLGGGEVKSISVLARVLEGGARQAGVNVALAGAGQLAAGDKFDPGDLAAAALFGFVPGAGLHGASELLRARAPIAHAALAAEGLDEAAKPSLPEGLAPEDAAPMYRDAIRRGEDPIANPLPEPPQADPTDRMSEDLKADVENGVADPLIARHVAALAPEQEQASLARQVASLRPANENEARLAISRALESEAAPVSQNLILSGDATPLEPLAQASYLEPKDFEAQTDDLEQHFADQRETALRQADADDTLPEKFHVEHDENGEHAPASETDVAREPARDFSTASRDPLDLVPVGERADGSDMRLVPREQLLAEQPRRSFLADLVDSCKN